MSKKQLKWLLLQLEKKQKVADTTRGDMGFMTIGDVTNLILEAMMR